MSTKLYVGNLPYETNESDLPSTLSVTAPQGRHEDSRSSR